MTKRHHRITTVVMAVLVITATGTLVGVASQDTTTPAATPISSCGTIDEPGHYVLTDDIENSTAAVCIDIQASDVHFDGEGHTIDGTITRTQFMEILRANPKRPPSRHVGVGVSVNDTAAVSNITITDVTTTEWVLGVLNEGASDATVRGVTSRATGTGIWVEGANDSLITASNTSHNYAIGVVVRAGPAPGNHSTNVSVVNVTANQNAQTGVGFLWVSDSVARNITATGNGYQGVHVRGGGPRNVTAEHVVVADNDLSRNGYAGVIVQTARNVTVVNTTVTGTQGTYPEFFPQAPPYPSSGIVVLNASTNDFRDITAREQATWAYFAAGNSTNTVQNLTTSAGVVSFTARDIGLAPTATAPVNASAPNATTINDDLLVLKMSADAFINLRNKPATTTTSVETVNETTTTAASVHPPNRETEDLADRLSQDTSMSNRFGCN